MTLGIQEHIQTERDGESWHRFCNHSSFLSPSLLNFLSAFWSVRRIRSLNRTYIIYASESDDENCLLELARVRKKMRTNAVSEANYNCKFFTAYPMWRFLAATKVSPPRDSAVAFATCLRRLAETTPSPWEFGAKPFSIIRETMGDSSLPIKIACFARLDCSR